MKNDTLWTVLFFVLHAYIIYIIAIFLYINRVYYSCAALSQF